METKGKIALITGANRGLGFEIARQLGKKQITVLVGARDEKAGKEAADKLIAVGLGLLRDYLETNFLGQVAVTQAFLPLIKESTSGRIVNMSSSIGSITIMSEQHHNNGGAKPARLPYALSKAALDMFTVLLARELKETPIKVNAADPGLTRTDAGGPSATYSVEEGARPAVWLATLDENGPTGCFFTHYFQHQTSNPW